MLTRLLATIAAISLTISLTAAPVSQTALPRTTDGKPNLEGHLAGRQYRLGRS